MYRPSGGIVLFMHNAMPMMYCLMVSCMTRRQLRTSHHCAAAAGGVGDPGRLSSQVLVDLNCWSSTDAGLVLSG